LKQGQLSVSRCESDGGSQLVTGLGRLLSSKQLRQSTATTNKKHPPTRN